MKIAVVGAGYVGLVTGACLADCGHEVTCVDNDKSKIERLQRNDIPIYEPGLEEMVSRLSSKGIMSFTDRLAEAVEGSDAVFIAVGTPPRPTDGHADLTFVCQVAEDIASAASGPILIVTKSTVPVGTGDEIEHIVKSVNPSLTFQVASNPEFLREGTAIGDFMNPDRIVIGTESPEAEAVLSAVYRPFEEKGCPVIRTDRRSAELIKYAANAFLAMKITYINEIARLCEALGSDVRTVARGIGTDSRIGEKFLQAGPGYGGSCFPKDTMALVKTAQDARAPIRLIEATTFINEQHKRAMAFKVVDGLGGNVRGKKVAILGLTFKANTDDMRESPAISIIQALQDFGAVIHAYDPEGMKQARHVLRNVVFEAGPYEAASDADAVVIVTEWDEFRKLSLPRIKEAMKGHLLVDLRNLFGEVDALQNGLTLIGVGRASKS